ncbi:hypothetical protein [Mesoplasma photuris]|uniref:hypothetical protein n=1 Tax=Mesoplasma photuris TaxID=217731 RepID=UPI0004E28395|nr:hypothetical protein [Mesoplasma photuris]
MTWDSNSNFLKTASGSDSPLLLISIIILIVTVILGAAFTYYFLNFKKNPAKAKIFGTKLLISLLVSSILIAILSTLGIALTATAKIVFDSNATTAFATILAIVIAAGVILLANVISLWFALPKFGISMDEEKISFMGEAIPYKRIVSVIEDDSKNAVYINYTQGTRTSKRQKFSKGTMFGQFILKNAELTGHKVEKGDADEHFKKMSAVTRKTDTPAKKK